MNICYICGKPDVDNIGPDNHPYYCVCFNRRFVCCEGCEQVVAQGIESDSHRFFCEPCYNRRYTRCNCCGRELNTTVARHFSGVTFCDTCYNDSYFICGNCGETHPRSNLYTDPDNQHICNCCFNDACITCCACERTMWLDEARYDHDNVYCRNCHRPSNEWEMGKFEAREPHYSRIKSQRRFGVELETSRCPDHNDLKDNTIWECKHDCSISGMEFVSPILYGDEGLDEIFDFCKIAYDKEFCVDYMCGYHAHFDVSGETEDSLRSIAYAYRKTYELWCSFVPESRRDNRMCGSPDYSCHDIINEDFDYFVGKRDRFEFVNWRAYLVHGSFEVRLYPGTLDAREICNWIIMHARFIDAVSKMTFVEIEARFSGAQFEALASIIGSSLAEYWLQKIERTANVIFA